MVNDFFVIHVPTRCYCVDFSHLAAWRVRWVTFVGSPTLDWLSVDRLSVDVSNRLTVDVLRRAGFNRGNNGHPISQMYRDWPAQELPLVARGPNMAPLDLTNSLRVASTKLWVNLFMPFLNAPFASVVERPTSIARALEKNYSSG